jgi:hypothetical protein
MYSWLKSVRPDGVVDYFKTLFNIRLKVMNKSTETLGKDYVCISGGSNMIPNGFFDLIFQRLCTHAWINYIRNTECMLTVVPNSIGLTRGLMEYHSLLLLKDRKPVFESRQN